MYIFEKSNCKLVWVNRISLLTLSYGKVNSAEKVSRSKLPILIWKRTGRLSQTI